MKYLMLFFWRSYFFLIAGMALFLFLPFHVNNFIEFLDFALIILSLIGLFGFAFQRKILTPSVWKLYFFTIITWDFFYNFFIRSFSFSASSIDWETLLFFVLLAPMYVGLFLYAFLSNSKESLEA